MIPKNRRRTALLALCSSLAAATANAAYPLRVDDTGTVPPGGFELIGSIDYVKQGGERGIALPLTLNFGWHPRFETSIEFGCQFAGSRNGGSMDWTDGFLDAVAGFKARLLEQETLGFSVGVSGGIKLPAASKSRGLGSGDVDAGILLILTRDWETFSLDGNAGYTFSKAFRGQRDPDLLSCGTALRVPLTETLETFVEVFAESDPRDLGGTIAITRAGFQFEFRKNLLWGGGIGTGIGQDAPDFLATTGLTWRF